MTIVCGDSHTSTHGALGALAFGVGASDVALVLATQSVWQRMPRTMRVTIDGELGRGVSAKDVALALIAKIGASGATGHVIEYTRQHDRGDVDGRAVDAVQSVDRSGARAGIIAPDETTFAYVKRPAVRAAGRRVEHSAGAMAHAFQRPGCRASMPRFRSTPRASRRWSPGATASRMPLPISGAVPDPASDRRARSARGDRAHARLYGPARGRAARRREDRLCVHRLVHERPHRGPALGGGDREGQNQSPPTSRRWSCRARRR